MLDLIIAFLYFYRSAVEAIVFAVRFTGTSWVEIRVGLRINLAVRERDWGGIVCRGRYLSRGEDAGLVSEGG